MIIKHASVLILSILIVSCSGGNDENMPEHLSNVDNLRVFEPDTEPSYTISFEREISFGETEDVLFQRLGPFTVDDSGRVIIGDSSQGTIHIFQPKGSYETSIGQKGSGPGDFQMINKFRAIGDQLYIFDHVSFRITVYSLRDFTVSRTIAIVPPDVSVFEELSGRFLSQTFIRSDGTFLTKYFHDSRLMDDDDYMEDPILYYSVDQNGETQNKVFEQQGRRWLTATVNGEPRRAQFSFLGTSLFAQSEDDYLFSAISDDFLITVRDPGGEYLYSIYYPVVKRVFSRQEAMENSDLDIHKTIIQRAPEEQLPDYWPILGYFIVDDHKRLWVSTVTDDEQVYEWWILQDTGELLARFTWPSNQPIILVKDSYLYAAETEENGLQRIVRYKLTMDM